MKRVPNGVYTKEFREEVVSLITEQGLKIPEASRRLSLPPSTIRTWLKAHQEGKLQKIGNQQKSLTGMELEMARLKRELAVVKMERDFLKKAAAYFAKESRPGTPL